MKELLQRGCCLLASLLCLSAITASAAGPEFFEQKVLPFVKAHCHECHSGNNPRASFSIEALQPDFSQPRIASRWAEVMDAINLGSMPPKDKPRPPATEVLAVAEWIGGEIRRVQRESRMAGGQVLLRRLNRDEYANTVVDLLSLDGYGMALENYDAIGAWRTHQDGEGLPGHLRRPLDPSGSLKSGRTFSTLKEYKQALLAERDRFGRAFVTTALTYALTRPVGVIDAEAVDEIYKQLENDEFRIHSVIHAIAGSRLFLTK